MPLLLMAVCISLVLAPSRARHTLSVLLGFVFLAALVAFLHARAAIAERHAIEKLDEHENLHVPATRSKSQHPRATPGKGGGKE